MLVIDRLGYQKWVFPPYQFYLFNVHEDLATWFGESPPLYHLYVSMPILFTSILPFVLHGTYLAIARGYATIQPALVALAAMFVFSLVSHMEYRFLYPLLPIGFMYAAVSINFLAGGLFKGAGPRSSGNVTRPNPESKRRRLWSVRNIVAYLLVTNVPAILYLNLVHQRGVVDVIAYLRAESRSGRVEDVGFLMPCHSTPYYSHLHQPIPMWFLSCEPPLEKSALSTHYWEGNDFETDPAGFMHRIFSEKQQITPAVGPSDLDLVNHRYEPGQTRRKPSHLVLYQCMAERIHSELMALCLSDGLMQEDYDDEEEYVYSEEEDDIGYSDYDMQSPVLPSNAKLARAEKQANSAGGYSYDDENEYFNTSDDDDDDDEQPTSAMKLIRKPWEVDFKAHDLSSIQATQKEIVSDLEPLLAVSRESTALLLRLYEWKTEPLVEDYLADPSKVLEKYGVHTHPPVPTVETGDEDFNCDICYCSGSEELYMALACGHRFCTSCYETYISMKVQEGGSWLIPCAAPKCKTMLGEDAARLILAENKDTLAKYESNLARSFVKSAASFTWCPAPNCDIAIECLVPRSAMDTVIPIVNCKCGKAFCFGCKVDDHVPAPCQLVKKWQKKCEDDSETANWIKVNTKECPKCNAVIEKNRGCNHMTCRECHHHFCWVCMGPWSEHGQAYYTCNRYNEDESENARKSISESRVQLERYMHYFSRYNNHEQSAKFAQNLLEATDKNMEHLQREMALAWIDVVFLKDAVDVLTACRSALKWTYVLAYYMVSDNQKIIFENNQSDLEMATEQLNELVEDPSDVSGIDEIKRKVLDMSQYVKTRLDTLLTDTYQGLQESRWQFED
ncbi:hypothetical protein GGI20_005689 [Coemansia sp. BCRC 34301]|nr:hypothetical protein GGI20_005689 [Coemansia sp. BCRC 34301]